MGAAVCLAGALVLVGWTFDVTLLKSVIPGFVAMNPATAVCFILAGVTLFLSRREPVSARGERVARICTVAILLVGLSVLLRYVGGWEGGLDQVFFRDKLARAAELGHRNRMAPNTALMFVLIACSLLGLDHRSVTIRKYSELLCLATALLAFLALTGYLYGATRLYGVPSYIPIALNTALAFGALTVGILAARPDRGLPALLRSSSPGGVLLRRLLPASLGVPLILGLIRLEGQHRGLYDVTGGVALFATLTMLSLTSLVYWSAVSLDRADIARRRAEQQVREANEDLEARVAERTVELRVEKERLRRTANELQALVQAAPIAIVGIDLDGKVLSWYGGAQRMFGWSAAEVIGKPLANVPGEKQDEFTALRRRVQAGESIIDLESHRIRKDGSRIDVSISYAPLQDHTGKTGGAIIVYQDITERRLAAEQRQARDAADAANRAKSNFLANMSHELRTPLNAIIGFSELLGDQTFGELNERQSRYVNNVLSSGRHLLQLVNDILDLAKIEAGRLILEPESIDLGSLLRDLQRGLEPLASAKGLSIALEVAPDLPALTADAAKVKQIMYNLLSNAIKFTKDGGRIGVRAATALDPSGEQQIQISVWDTGVGIAPADLERIFLEFEQVDSTYVRQQEGTGLGLALTKRLVEAHGGRIWVESTVNEGSTFSIVLPTLLRPTSIEPWQPTSVRTPETSGEGPLVLVVEDDTNSRELLCHYLSAHGYRVAYAPNAAQALELARGLRPAAISLDMFLPDEHGLQLLSKLRSDPATKDIPVVVVSITDDRELGFTAGAAAWLVKPVRQREFIDALDRLVPVTAGNGRRLALVVDDDPEAVELASDVLRGRGFEVLQAFGGTEGLDLAIHHSPSLIVLDLNMPGVSGFTMAQQLRAHRNTRQIPILVSTAMDLTGPQREALMRDVQTVVAKRGAEAILEALERLGLNPPDERSASTRTRSP
jgi:PAS domain S-box-containing protein